MYLPAITILILATTALGLKFEDSINNHLSTETPYRFVANNNIDEDEGCSKKIWMYIRHGTRYPDKSDIKDMLDRLPELQKTILKQSQLTDDDLELFQQWKPSVEVDDKKTLAPEGRHEMEEIALRMQARYPHLLPTEYNNDTYYFRHTDKERTETSAKHFVIGLFGNEEAGKVKLPETMDEDLVLSFYNFCPKYEQDVEDNKQILNERKEFEASAIVQKAVSKIDDVLSFKGKLTVSDVKLMYKTCSFETAWKVNSPWCLVFDVETAKVFEFAEDLEYYWIDGYGYEITHKIACPAFGDLISFLEDEESPRKGNFYFTHSGGIYKFMAHLGLYDDGSPLIATDYTTKDRLWNMSKIGNFATNLAFVLHECNSTKQISVMHNEHVIRLPSCPDSDLCDLETVKNYYSESLNYCDFAAMCAK